MVHNILLLTVCSVWFWNCMVKMLCVVILILVSFIVELKNLLNTRLITRPFHILTVWIIAQWWSMNKLILLPLRSFVELISLSVLNISVQCSPNWPVFSITPFLLAVVLSIWALWIHSSGFSKSVRKFMNSMNVFVALECTLPTSDQVISSFFQPFLL